MNASMHGKEGIGVVACGNKIGIRDRTKLR
jgi:hypothetical protein